MTSTIMRIRSVLKRRSSAELATMVIDRLVRAFGLSPISFTRWGATPAPVAADGTTSPFEKIAMDNAWGSSESLSGQGSELKQSAPYRQALIKLIRKRNIGSMFDAPCGDMNWMPAVLREIDISYVGGDISNEVVNLNRTRLPQLDFRVINLACDPFPKVELWHCRDCLFHLSYDDIRNVLRNYLSSGIPLALLTTYRGLLRNQDINTGGWRYLDLCRAPLSIPAPLELLPDYLLCDLPRYVGLWSREQIASALEYSSFS